MDENSIATVLNEPAPPINTHQTTNDAGAQDTLSDSSYKEPRQRTEAPSQGLCHGTRNRIPNKQMNINNSHRLQPATTPKNIPRKLHT